MTPEAKVKAKVDRVLATLPYCYKFKPVQNGMGAPGLDYYCCIGSRFVAIETKAPGKKLTPRQQETRNQIIRAYGTVFVVWDDASLREMVNTIAINPCFYGHENAEAIKKCL